MTDQEVFNHIENKLFTVIYKKTMELYPDMDTFTYVERKNVRVGVSRNYDEKSGYFAYILETDRVKMEIGYASLSFLKHHDVIMIDLDRKKLTGMTRG